jgi:hypothetical protein
MITDLSVLQHNRETLNAFGETLTAQNFKAFLVFARNSQGNTISLVTADSMNTPQKLLKDLEIAVIQLKEQIEKGTAAAANQIKLPFNS